MKKMKYLAIMLFLTIAFSCTNNNNSKSKSNELGVIMINQIDTLLPSDSLGNFCNNETIPSRMDKWVSVPYRDSDGKKIIKYLYIKKMDSLQVIYTIMQNYSNDSVHFIKRITKK